MFLRKIQRTEYRAPEVSVTIDPKPRHCNGSKTWKKTSCKSRFADDGRNTHAPWAAATITSSTAYSVVKSTKKTPKV